jgi:integrase
VPKIAPELSPAKVRNLMDKPGLHAVGGVNGLLLQVSRGKSSGQLRRSWILRAVVGAKRRDIGLGSYPTVTVGIARDRAREVREQIRQGMDPTEQRRKARAELIAKQAVSMTFAQAANAVTAMKATGFRNAKHAAQWASTLDTYANPVIGKLPVEGVTLDHVVSILEPIWLTKTETAKRLRGRIESVLAWAAVKRSDQSYANPARWNGNLDVLLPAPGKVAKVEHFKALPIYEIGGFMADLRQRKGEATRALEFQILTATWPAAIRFARWGEIDFDRKVWTIPGERLLKRGEQEYFRVPLPEDALALLRRLGPGKADELVFPAPRGGPLSDASLSAVMKRMKVDATPHGSARSTFKDWAAERTSYDNIVSEVALAHVNGCKVEQSYRRGDLFERRRRLMRDWAKFLATVQPATTASVISLKSA